LLTVNRCVGRSHIFTIEHAFGYKQKGTGHSSRMRFYVFFEVQKTRLFTFFEVSCQKTLKTQKALSKFSLFSAFKMPADTFAVKQLHTCHVMHTTLY